MRYEGQVRNRHFGKRETALLIKDIWTAKAAAEAEVIMKCLNGLRHWLMHELLEYGIIEGMLLRIYCIAIVSLTYKDKYWSLK